LVPKNKVTITNGTQEKSKNCASIMDF